MKWEELNLFDFILFICILFLGENDNDSSVDEILQAFEQEPSSPELEKALSKVKMSKRRRHRKSYKRPSNNPVYMPALRILRRDIRRRYCEMMNNVVNSYDSSLILNFFHDFSIPNLQRVLYYPMILCNYFNKLR